MERVIKMKSSEVTQVTSEKGYAEVTSLNNN